MVVECNLLGENLLLLVAVSGALQLELLVALYFGWVDQDFSMPVFVVHVSEADVEKVAEP